MENLPIKQLPYGLGCLRELRTFLIYECPQFESLPHTIGYLSLLTSMMVTDAPKLKILPKAINQLQKLKYLNVSGCDKSINLSDVPHGCEIIQHNNY